MSAAEARSGGVNWTFSPMVDVTRDPRWGRVVEGFGEDSFLAAAFGAAKVRAYQGDDLASADAIAACLKHFVAYGAAEAGRDYNTTDLSQRRLRETYLEPFRAGVTAGAASVMAAFNSLNGTPMHAHRRLLTDVLTGEYGFGGVVVGDADGVAQLVAHGVASDEADAVRQSLSAGLDIVMGGSELARDGAPLLEPGTVDAARIDDAVMRILRLKQALGLFENPYTDAAVERSAPTAETLGLAQQAAERCVVLLKNDDSLLPVAAAGKRILLTGPYADEHRSSRRLGAALRSSRGDARGRTAGGIARRDVDGRSRRGLPRSRRRATSARPPALARTARPGDRRRRRAELDLGRGELARRHPSARRPGAPHPRDRRHGRAVHRAARDRPAARRRGLDRSRARGAADLAPRHARRPRRSRASCRAR